MKFISATGLLNRLNCCTFDPQRNWAGYELNPICPAVVCPCVHLAFCLLHTNAFPRRADWPKGTATAYISTPCFFDTTVRNSSKWHVQIYASSLQGGGHSPPPPFFLLLLLFFLPFGYNFLLSLHQRHWLFWRTNCAFCVLRLQVVQLLIFRRLFWYLVWFQPSTSV